MTWLIRFIMWFHRPTLREQMRLKAYDDVRMGSMEHNARMDARERKT